ncbi:hypothetical protein [Amycolatopsis sp. NBC_01480]|uniref:hypothetical protein n=1 Tax=Amycolatopsis sp. NBC_01480 TaxID=2903562 RepID=UPI002E2AEEBA|nr:hypothetical protein [Amycolatopsis sp. NBC_01480]
MSRKTQRRGAQRENTVDLHAPIGGQLDLFVPSAETPVPKPRAQRDDTEPEPQRAV